MSNALVKLTPPGLKFTCRNASDNPVDLPSFPLRGLEIENNQWIRTTVIASAVNASHDPVAGTSSGTTTAQVDKNLDSFSNLTRAGFFAIALRKKDAATADLLGNTVTVKIGGATVGILNVNENTGNTGWMIIGGDGAGDTRFSVGPQTNVTGGAIESDTELYTKSAHGLYDGQKVTLVSMTGGTGGTLATGVMYFHKLTADTGTFHATYANAIANTTPLTCAVDATSVVLTPHLDIGYNLTSVDPNLEVHSAWIGTDS